MPKQPYNALFVINATVVTLLDREFVSGYQDGYSTYHTLYAGTPQSDLSLYQFLLSIIDVRHEGRRQAGYITGWMAGFFETHPGANATPEVITTPNEPEPPIDPIALMRRSTQHLN